MILLLASHTKITPWYVTYKKRYEPYIQFDIKASWSPTIHVHVHTGGIGLYKIFINYHSLAEFILGKDYPSEMNLPSEAGNSSS